MKSLAMFVGLCVLVSFVYTTAVTTDATSFIERDQPCDSKCLACQQTVFNLKFTRKPGCTKDHCRTTCYKVWQEWSQPGSPFTAFQNDSEGKCEVCFRAGYCSMDECSVQKKFEVSVINSVVDQAEIKGTVETTSLTDLVKNVVKGKKINFKKVSQQVRKLSGRLIKHGPNSLVVRGFSRMLKAVNKGETTKQFLKLLKGAGRKMTTFAQQNKGISRKIQSLIKAFRGLADHTNSKKVRANKKGFSSKKKAFLASFKSINKVINNATMRFHTQIAQLESVRVKLFSNKDKKVQEKIKAIDRYLGIVKGLLRETQQASNALKKIFDSVKL